MKKGFGYLCFTWLVLSVVPFAEAYTNGCGNNRSPLCCPNNATVGANPIKPYTANEQRSITDLETFGAAPIQFTRIYNSRTVSFTTNYMEFQWKQTWQHNWNYEMRDLSSTTYGFHNIKIRYPDGTDFNFVAADASGDVRVSDAFFGSRLYPWDGTNIGYTLVTPSGWEYDFQRTSYPRYELLQVRNGQGAEWDLTYNETNSRLERIENNFGRWIEIERNTANSQFYITSVESSDGREVIYAYEPWQYTNVEEEVVSQIVISGVVYNVMGWVTNVFSNNVLSDVYYPDSSHAEYTYVGAQSLTNGRPLLATASDPCYPGPGARMKYVYNYDAVFDFGSGPYLVTGTTLEERSLDTDEILVQMPLGSGDYPQILLGEDEVEVTHIYTNGLLIEQRDEEGRPTYYSYDQGGVGHLASVMDAESNTTSFVRDYAGRILRQVDPLGNTNHFTYNDDGFLLSHTNPLGYATTYTRDTNNLLTRTDYPDGSFEEWDYNAYGQPLTNRLRNGGYVTYSYYGTNETGGGFGDLKTVTDPMSNTTTYTWNEAGLPTGITDARTNTTRFSYSWRGQLLAVTNADDTVMSSQYDAFNNLTNSVDELGRSTAYTYDQFDRVQTVRDPLGRTNTFEYGRTPGCGGCGVFDETITRITDSAGKVTEYAYDLSGRRTNETIAAGTPEAAATAWSYDTVGRKQTQLDANGNLHTWFYDAAGQVVAESNAAGEVTTYAYDAVGNQTNRVDGEGVTTFAEYDAINQRVAYGSGNLRYEYAYDSGGRQTSMYTRVNGAVEETTTYSYDLNDRLLSKIDPSGYVLAYEYDAAGQRSRFSISNVLDISYAYDERNRLLEIDATDTAAQFAYDATGQRTNAVWPNGTVAAYTYDDAGQLLSLIHGRAGSPNPPLASFLYAYDLSGNRTNMITLEGTNRYVYDARNWLTEAAYPDGCSEAYLYDSVGNRTSLVEVTTAGITNVTASAYGSVNRLLSSTAASETNAYSYDDAGRLAGQTVNGQSRTHEYDFMSRMTNLTDTNSSVFSYEFDGEGKRNRQNLNDCLETRFVYDGPNVVMELNGSNEVVCAYVLGLGVDQPIERIDFINGTARKRQVFHADGLGSISLLTDENGAGIQSYAYDAFGEIRTKTGSELNRIAFTAREALGDSLGFYYYRNRVVDAHSGRFTSEDPRGFMDGANRYVYVRNGPMNLIDPFGLAGGNPVSGGGAAIYYPNGGWNSANVPGVTYANLTYSPFAFASSLSMPAAKCAIVGAALTLGGLAVYYASPSLLAGGAAIITTGQNVFYRVMIWQPSSILYYNQIPPAGSSVAQLCASATPYANQFVNGMAPPSPFGPFTSFGRAVSWGTGYSMGGVFGGGSP